MAPTAPPGLAPGPADSEAELQKEITNTIEHQVRQLLQQARTETEGKVKIELKGIIEKMMAMEKTLDQLNQQLDVVEGAKDGGPATAVTAEAVSKMLSNVEQQWGQEIKTLKEELHQTILAHNHNADLIKHHKETLDALQERSHKMASGNQSTPADVQARLAKLDKAMKMQQQKQPQNKVESLAQRLHAVELQVQAQAQNTHISRLALAQQWRGYAGMGAGAAGMPPGMLAGLGGLPGLGGPDAASLLP